MYQKLIENVALFCKQTKLVTIIKGKYSNFTKYKFVDVQAAANATN
jgi:hypothetical protein